MRGFAELSGRLFFFCRLGGWFLVLLQLLLLLGMLCRELLGLLLVLLLQLRLFRFIGRILREALMILLLLGLECLALLDLLGLQLLLPLLEFLVLPGVTGV